MTVRITRTTDDERTVLGLAGRLEAADLATLDDQVHLVEGALSVDLSELMSADEAGIKTLRDTPKTFPGEHENDSD